MEKQNADVFDRFDTQMSCVVECLFLLLLTR